MRDTKEVLADHPHLEERYFERMASSMGDKSKLLEFLPPANGTTVRPKILDVGAGSGDFSDILHKLGYDVTALDASDDAIMHMRERFPYITTANMLANEADQLGEGTFDAVVCSSILHEVLSYGDNFHNKGHMSSIVRALESFYKLLKPGGVLLIRDGVLPDNWEELGTVTLLDGHENESVFKYLKMCPFANGQAYGEVGNLVRLTQVGEKTFRGNVRSLLEFAYTYTWGLDSYPRETQELYAVNTLDDYATLIENLGFTVEYKEAYLQEGYPVNLNTKLRLQVGDKVDDWFNSNAIWIARKG